MSKTILIENEKSFLTIEELDDKEIMGRCVEEVNNKLLINPEIYLYGKPAIQHRGIGFFSNTSIGYYYSGQLTKSQLLTPSMQQLLEIINKKYSTEFNGILVNRYNDGNDYIGSHYDKEDTIDQSGVIAISYGAVRKFRIRNAKTKVKIMDILTENNQIIHMGGNFQKEYMHEIPIEKKVKEPRWSFTFRKHISSIDTDKYIMKE